MRIFHVVMGVLVGALALCLVGCASATAPTFRVVEAELTQETAAGYVVTFTLEGENRNGFPLPLRDVDYRLVMDGNRVFSGVRSAEVTLPAGGVGLLELPVSVASTSGAPAAADYALRGRVTYVLPGAIAELLLENRIRTPRASFEERGELVGG